MKENIKFILRVMAIHIITYLVCGMIFKTLFNYDELYLKGNTQYFMRPIGSYHIYFGSVFQIVRGLLFGLILLLVKDSIIQKKFGWLKLWAIIVVIGIFNTPAPAPCSIEGLIYTQLPLEFMIKGAPEIFIQTLLFSYFVANPVSMKFRGLTNYRIPILSAVSAGAMFMFSGIVLALILGLDIMAGTKDMGAFLIMFIAVITVFAVSKWYGKSAFHFKHIVFLVSCYVMLAVLPTGYNYMTGSIFASPLALGINMIPVIILFFMNYRAD